MMMKYLFLFLIFSLSCTNSDKVTIKPEIDTTENPISEEISYLALGDSYTIGESVDEENRFPVQLINQDFGQQVKNKTVDIIATTGWTTRNLLDAIDKQNPPTGKYDFITLLIGVNNQYQGIDIDIYRRELKELIEISLGLLEGDSSRLVLVSIPDYGVTPFASSRDSQKIALEIDQYNQIKEQYAMDYGCPYVYITDLTRQAATNDQLIASDGLHPSGQLYRLWIPRLKPVIQEIIDNL